MYQPNSFIFISLDFFASLLYSLAFELKRKTDPNCNKYLYLCRAFNTASRFKKSNLKGKLKLPMLSDFYRSTYASNLVLVGIHQGQD